MNANIVLLDENPLENIWNSRKIRGVMTQGCWIPKIAIDKRLEKIRNSYAELRKKKFN